MPTHHITVIFNSPATIEEIKKAIESIDGVTYVAPGEAEPPDRTSGMTGEMLAKMGKGKPTSGAD